MKIFFCDIFILVQQGMAACSNPIVLLVVARVMAIYVGRFLAGFVDHFPAACAGFFSLFVSAVFSQLLSVILLTVLVAVFIASHSSTHHSFSFCSFNFVFLTLGFQSLIYLIECELQ